MIGTITNEHGETLDTAFHSGERENVLVILGHGVTGNKDRPLLVHLATQLSLAGWPCLRLSFSGNGDSQGSFGDSTITKEITDLQSLLETLPAETKVAYIGHSMGAAVGLLTAVREEKISVLVSLAGMIHTADFLSREFGDVVPGQCCMWEDEDCPLSENFAADMQTHGHLLDAAAAVEVPWLLIHGDADDVVPLHDSQSAADAATTKGKQLLTIPGAGHSFDETSYPTVTSAIQQWLESHLR